MALSCRRWGGHFRNPAELDFPGETQEDGSAISYSDICPWMLDSGTRRRVSAHPYHPTPIPSPGCGVLPFSQPLWQSAWWSQGSPPGPFLLGSSRRPRRGERAGRLPMFWGWFWTHSAASWALTAVSHKGESGIGAQSILFSSRSK